MRGAACTIIALCVGLGACTTPLTRSAYKHSESTDTASEATRLTPGDAQLVAGNYRAAIDQYDSFLRANPASPDASRMRATRAILGRLARDEAIRQELERAITIRDTELERAWNELAALQHRVAWQDGEIERLRLSSFQIWRAHEIREDELQRVMAALAEAKRAKKDLELLKSLDLQLEQRVR